MPDIHPQLVVSQPPNNLIVKPNQPFAVTGQVTNAGRPGEPVVIDAVTVQVDGGPATEATLKRLPDKKKTVVAFQASAQVTGGRDPHTVTVTATNDEGLSATSTVAVFTGPIFQVDAPALELDISPVNFDLSDPKVAKLLSHMQQALRPLAGALASVGKMLAGPNLALATDAAGRPVLRLGLWIEDPSFPVLPPAPPDFPLPRLIDAAAAAGFATVPLLPVPEPAGLGPAFALSIPVATLQHLLDAVAPAVKLAAKQNDVSVDSMTVQTFPPATVLTSFRGSLPLDIPFSIAITENLGTKQAPDSIQMVPAVIGSSYSASVGSFLDWFIGFLFPIFELALLGALGAVSSVGGQVGGQITGIMASLLAGIPSRIPFHNTDLPASPLPLPDFPTLLPNWKSFGVTNSGIIGTGTTTIEARDQTMAALATRGARHIVGYQEDLAGGAGQGYTFTLHDLAPDAGKFSWQASGAGSDRGAIEVEPFEQAGSFGVVFPLPLDVKPGKYPFTLAVHASETCGTNPSKTLSGSASIPVLVEVVKNPKTPP